MNRKLAVAAIVLALILGISAIHPRPARAVDTTDVLIYTGIGVGALVVIALVATALTRRSEPIFLSEPALRNPYEPSSGLRFGLACAPRDGAMPLACW